MIISASRRTDIPAFYSDWMMNRIKEKYCLVPNPNNPKMVRRIDLSPEAVDAFIFWTKNPKPMFSKLARIDDLGYSYIFLYTLNDYPKYMEPHVPCIADRIESFKDLSSKIGPKRVIWRYDPIVLTNKMTPEYHTNNFARTCEALSGMTVRVIISFLDLYKFVENRLKTLLPSGEILYDISSNRNIMYELSANLAKIASSHNMEIYSCAEIYDLRKAGILPGACIDGLYLTAIFEKNFTCKKDKNQRPECNCVLSADIGQYDTCRHRCIYCYANRSSKIYDRNIHLHNCHSPALIGWPQLKEPLQCDLI